jgi:molecular chaperone DnaK (HSP70)
MDDELINFISSEQSTPIQNDSNLDEEIIIGIDLGTTNSCVCYWENNNVIIIPDEKGNKTIPSYVSYTNISRYVGIEAKNQSLINSNNVYYEVKRLMGKSYSDSEILKEKNLLSYTIGPDSNDQIILHSNLDGEKTFTPEEISAVILSKLKLMASTFLKRKITKAVITIPARFTDSQRLATANAAKIAGLECLRMIHEPTAAAMAYGLINRKIKSDEILNVLVYDFGGGTLDVSIVEISSDDNNSNIFTVIGSAGNTHLGGADFDQRLISYSIARFKKTFNISKLINLPALSMQKLKQSCENVKKILSSKTKAYIAVKEFYEDKDLFFAITRSEFETITADLFMLALKPVEDILECCDLSSDLIDEIILVGGMTRIPLLIDRLEQKFKKKPNISLNPDEAIATGAAIQGYILSNTVNNPFADSVCLLDITPLSLGVETYGGIMNVIIPRNTIIPYSMKKIYSTDTDYAKSVLIKAYEGERQMTTDNIFIGEFILSNIPSHPRGIPQIEVEFLIDINGVITISALELESNESSSIIVTSNKSGLSPESINKLILEASELEIRDEILRVKKLYAYEIDDLCSNIMDNIKNSNFKLNKTDSNIIIEDIERVYKWSREVKYSDRSNEEFVTILDQLKKKYGVLIIKGNLDQNTKVEEVGGGESSGTNIYLDDDDKTYQNILNIDENLIGMSDNDQEEIKILRTTLNDLCYSIFDLIDNPSFSIEATHKKELRDFIDDTLLWICSHEKPTKNDYMTKIDEINLACDDIMNSYEKSNKEIFSNDSNLVSNVSSKSLENTCLALKVLLNEKSIQLKTSQTEELLKKISLHLEFIDSKINICKDNFELECEERLNDLNSLCNDLHMKMQGINLNIGISDIIPTSTSNNMGGTSIEDLLKQRQCEEIEQIMIDSIDIKPDIMIEDVQY